MKAFITVLTGDRAGEKIQLPNAKAFIFGRDETTDFPLVEKKVSRRHASLFWDAKRQSLLIEDLKSLNGTFVNGQQISGSMEIRDLDRFQLGSFLFEISIPTERQSKPRKRPDTSDLGPSPRVSEDEGEIEILSPISDSEIHADDENRQTDGTSISGNLREIALPDLLQLLASTKKTGKLVIAAKKSDVIRNPAAGSGVFYIQEGQLIAAEFKSFRNEEAFYELLKWNAGYFSLFYKETTSVEKKIWLPLEALLLEGARRMDEEKTQNIEFSPNDVFDVNLDEPLTSLDSEQLRIFQLVLKKKKMADVWASSHLDQKVTNSVLRQLIRLGFIKKR